MKNQPKMPKILMLLPVNGYDPTESSVPWAYLRQAGYEVNFASPHGNVAYADDRLVSKGFGILSPIFMTRGSSRISDTVPTGTPR